MNASEAQARVAIAEKLNRYVVSIDHGNYAEVAKCFAEDAVFWLSKSNPPRGREEIVKRLGGPERRPFPDGIFQRHNITSSLVDFVSDTEATARTYVVVYTELGLDHNAIYEDRFAKIGDEWLIAERSGTIDHMHPDSRFGRSARFKPS